ncbi:unnamed protein product [Meloidogyne enterolobii]|uniref:Uncharacterized protein n=1 Tax=Meloidogyne enterolobii TaxID=390850 RepID=A0ACB0YMF6_MELEN
MRRILVFDFHHLRIITKLQSRLENALSQRRFYDAHQIIRTLQTRMLQKQINVNDPNSEANVEELLELIYNCCLTFCKVLLTLLNFMWTLLFTKLPGKLEGEEINSDDKDSETFDSDKSLPKDRRTPFLNKTLDWALKNTGGCPDLLNSVVLLQQRFAKVLENEGRNQQAERLNKAADWLVKEINRKMQSTSGTSHSLNKEEMTGEQQINQTGQGVSDIDLD